MRYLHGLCGAALLAALAGCAGTRRPAKVAEESPNATAAASDETPAAQTGSSREFQLVDGTFACMLSSREPAVVSPGKTGDEATPKGAAELEENEATAMDVGESSQCAATAHAMGLSPAALGVADQAATDRVRRVLHTLLSKNDVAPDMSEAMSALFDRGVAAIEAERTIRQALRERRDTAPTIDVKQSDALRDLHQFGHDMPLTTIGAEAQALVWVLGAKRFAEVPLASAQNKIVAAEALVSSVLDTPRFADRTGKSASWNQYIASAVRTIRSSVGARSGGAIGGGPLSAGDDDNVRAIISAAQVQMRGLTKHLHEASAMRAELTQAASQLDAFTEGE